MSESPQFQTDSSSVCATASSRQQGRLIVRGAAVFFVPTFMVLLVLAFSSGRSNLGWDAILLHLPYFTLIADCVRHGVLALWDPWSNCGMPLAAYVELGPFSPLTLLTAGATDGGVVGLVIYWFASWALGAVGMYLLSRHMGAAVWSSVLITLGFSFSGFYLGQASYVSHVHAYSFLPWIVWRLDAALLGGRSWPAIEAGALFGLSALGGYPAIVIINSLVVGAWIIGRMGLSIVPDRLRLSEPSSEVSRQSRRKRLRFLGLTVAFGVTGLVVMAPAYAAFYFEAHGYSDRIGALDRKLAIDNHRLPVSALATIVSSELTTVRGDVFWGRSFSFFGLANTYTGVMIPALALLAIIGQPLKKWNWWLVLCIAFFMSCAIGSALPIRGWVYDLFPPSRYFRLSALFRAHGLFCLSVLAINGARLIDQPLSKVDALPDVWRTFLTISSLFVPAAMLVCAIGFGASAVDEVASPLISRTALLLWLLVPVTVAGWMFWGRRRVEVIASLLITIAMLDATIAYRHSLPAIWGDPGGNDLAQVYQERNRDLELHQIQRMPPDLDGLNVLKKVPTIESFSTLNNRFHTNYSQEALLASGKALPIAWTRHSILFDAIQGPASRIWFSDSVAEVAPTDACFRGFLDRTAELIAMPLVIHPRDQMMTMLPPGELGPDDYHDRLGIRGLAPARRLDTTLSEYTMTRLAFEVTCPGNGWLLVTDRFARGWQARIDGRPTEIKGGNFLFRAVRVTQGTHRIEFEYHPFGIPMLLIVSWGVMAVVGIGSVVAALRNRSGTEATVAV